MREKLAKILGELRPDVDFEEETSLIDDNVLESFDIIELVSTLNDEFDIKISPRDLTAENFNSLDSLLRLVEALMDEDD